ncbi:conserved hypothetical protein [Roseivivax lentus]|uniref:EthD domain-containing protein n=1 Tax=Roseivivax lentus TaxID=633194 RepID=A0A1N7KBM1_9RHOB|nr:EthD family reductase [Roseivivax lentus]SIS58995.1 conserved hypothetical protein [Roseivivax lentus]
MPSTLQVIYPVAEGKSFDYDYYLSTHMDIVKEHMSPHYQAAHVTRGLAGGAPGAAPDYFAIATFTCADQDALQAMIGAAGPAIEDLANFTDCDVQMLVGEAAFQD